jgi:hypothetical protein
MAAGALVNAANKQTTPTMVYASNAATGAGIGLALAGISTGLTKDAAGAVVGVLGGIIALFGASRISASATAPAALPPATA